MQKFHTNQIVEGVTAGTFVVLAPRTIGGSEGFQVKAVNPSDHSQTGSGELWLPADALKRLPYRIGDDKLREHFATCDAYSQEGFGTDARVVLFFHYGSKRVRTVTNTDQLERVGRA